MPTKKVITLKPSEYAKLKDTASVMDDFVPELLSGSFRVHTDQITCISWGFSLVRSVIQIILPSGELYRTVLTLIISMNGDKDSM